MNDREKFIRLHHGSGGGGTQKLIRELFLKYFDNPVLGALTDSAVLSLDSENIAFTTDSYVIDPIFFPGGDIGKLAICGTVNDLAVSGAKPLWISAGFIIEEGLPMDDLEKIVRSMAEEARLARVKVVTGDTKVVNKGKCDKIFINTSGIGILDKKFRGISFGRNIRPGDRILINGTIGDHGMAVMNARESFHFTTSLVSDCHPLNQFIAGILKANPGIKFMRDATRGGLAAILCEMAEKWNVGIEVDETQIPVTPEVRAMCELLGFDPAFVANEGKVVLVCSDKGSQMTLQRMKRHKDGKNSSVIGTLTAAHPGRVIMNTLTGGKRMISMPAGEQLPRIC